MPVVSQCPVNIKVYKKKYEEQLKECDVIKDDDKKYMLMKIPYVKNKPVVEAIFNETNDKKHLMISIIELYTASLKAIDILIDKKIVHFDLKSDNILYDTQINHMKFIDFGLSIPIEKLQKENLKDYFYIYAPEYFVWPLEVHVINFLIHEHDGTNVDKKYVDDISNKIASEYVENNKGLNMFSREFRNKYIELCVLQIEKYLKPGKKNTIINNLIKYYETWDNYSISIMLLRIVDFLFPNEFVENMFYEVFSQLLLYNIHPNPLKRFNISETFNKYYEIFHLNKNIKTYFDALNSIDIDFSAGIKMLNKENDLLNNSINKTIY